MQSLGKVSGIMQGWGKHYRFCNDGKSFESIDAEIGILLTKHLAIYREEREKADTTGRWRLLGIEALARIEREPFVLPKKSSQGMAMSASRP
jgi:RNA-directed DNA polymerase